jgi:hypothetical protein
MTVNNLNPAAVLTAKTTAFHNKVIDKSNEANTSYNPDKETRAYADGKAGYTNLSNAITP